MKLLLSNLAYILLFHLPNPTHSSVNLVPFVESINKVTTTFRQSDCAVVENSLGNELCPFDPNYPRTLLRFSTGVWNQGNTDLQVSRTANPEWFEWGSCHRHYHFKNFTLYELVNEANNEVVTGRKQAFCLMDIRKMDPSAGSSKYGCSNQGITAGWADIYSYNLDGQWIDITGVPAGSYTLRVTINYGRDLTESDYTDNTAIKLSSQDSDLILTGSPCGAALNADPSPPLQTCSVAGQGCDSNEECCTEQCDHNVSLEAKISGNQRFLRDVAGTHHHGRMLQSSSGTCVCTPRGEPCVADHHCCSGNCNFKGAKCAGSA